MLADLLLRGYFPKELPRPFTTTDYANALTAKPAPSSWSKPRVSQASSYSLARVGMFRRPLAICNPVQFYGLSEELNKSWPLLAPLLAGTPLSATAPTICRTGRTIQGRFPLGAKPQRAIECRLGRRFVLQTDISRFYSSIYTHSIPWAIHGKLAAKADKTTKLFGNRIDTWVRQGQDQQTVGIPIGPDTSLVLAELLMQRCDRRLLGMLPDVKGYRYIDDYELSFRSRTEAEEAYHILESCLSEFELALNPKKTAVRELPILLEAEWSVALRRFNMRTSKTGISYDLEHYFSLAFELHRKYPDESVLQYAIARLRSLEVSRAHWEKLQQLFLLCVAPEPACFPYAIDIIIDRKNKGAPILRSDLTEAIESLIIEHSPLRHSSEVANAVWAALALRLRIGSKAIKAVSKCGDPVVALLALDYKASGLCRPVMDTTLWQSYMSRDELHRSHWLLAYEARIKDWLPSNDVRDHIVSDAHFSHLAKMKVSFYDVRHTSQRGGKSPLPRLPAQMGRVRAYGP